MPAWDEAWEDYRQAMVYGLFMGAVTLLVDPRITATLVQRLGAAVAHHEPFVALGV